MHFCRIRNTISGEVVLDTGRGSPLSGVVDPVVEGLGPPQGEGVVKLEQVDALGWKFMSCSQVKSWVNLQTWLLIGRSLLCSQSGAC